RFSRDWSSDVCSSDLHLRETGACPHAAGEGEGGGAHYRRRPVGKRAARAARQRLCCALQCDLAASAAVRLAAAGGWRGRRGNARSEERRVGKEERERG